MRLLRDMMLLRMEQPPDRSDGGIIIPNSARADAGSSRAQRAPKLARVLAVGPGARTKKRGARVAMSVAIGDRVLMDPLAELIEADSCDPSLRYAIEFQCAAVLG